MDRMSSLPPWPSAPKLPSPQVMMIPLSLAKTENPSPAPTLVMDLALRASTQCGRDLQLSTSPWPSWPRRPSPQVNTIRSDVSAMMCVLLTDTCTITVVNHGSAGNPDCGENMRYSACRILDLGGSWTGVRVMLDSYPFR